MRNTITFLYLRPGAVAWATYDTESWTLAAPIVCEETPVLILPQAAIGVVP